MLKTFYEGGIGLTTEKQPVVFDFGQRYTKIGFAGEPAPRAIIPTEVRCTKTDRIQKVFEAISSSEQYDLLVDFIHNLYFRHLLVSPKDRRVVIVESVLCPTHVREMLAKVFFMHYEVSSLLFVPSHVVALSTLGVNTALVVDMGAAETVVIPVYEGVAVLHAWQAQPLGSIAVERRITDMLMEYAPPEWFEPAEAVKSEDSEEPVEQVELEAPGKDLDFITSKHIEDIKVRTCFVTSLERVQKTEQGQPCPPPPSVNYLMGGSGHVVKVGGDIRENAFNILFEQDADRISVSTMILDAISQCSVDMRKPLAENIFLIGGTSMTMGMQARINQELKYLVATTQYCDKLKVRSFKFHSPPAKENFTAWLGGAIYGATDLVSTRSITKEAFSKNLQIPDWVSLIHNNYHDGIKRSV